MRGAGATVAELARIVRFGLVGGSSAAVYAVIMLGLADGLSVSPVWASAVAYVVAIPLSYLGQRRFTFRSKDPVRGQLPGFAALQGINFLAALGVTHLVTDMLGLGAWASVVAVIVVIVVIALLSYCAMAFGIFRKSSSMRAP